MGTLVVKAALARKRRRHAVEYRAQVVEACKQPGISVAAVALANGLNANLVRRWINEHHDGVPIKSAPLRSPISLGPQATTLVPVTPQSPGMPPGEDIRIDIRRGAATVQLAWPVTQVAALGDWLKELLR